MLKQGTFLRHKYRALLLCNLFTSASYCINMMVDAILGGNKLGETALTAVSIVAPLFSAVYFLDYLVSPGLGILYGKHIGEFDRDSAYKTAGQSLVYAAFTSLFLLLSLLLVKEPFLRLFSCTGQIYVEASTYYNWVIVYAMLHPFNVALYYLILADSDSLIAMLGTIGEIVTNVSLSLLLCGRLGIAGLGIATALGTLMSVAIFPLHLLRKSNSIHFKLSINRQECKKAFALSLSRCSAYLYIALVDMVMNKIIQLTCGQTFIPVYSVVNLAFAAFEVTCAAFDSGAGFLSAYLGERNNYGIMLTAKTILRADVWMSGIIMLLFFFGAPLFPKLYGMTSPEIVSAAEKTARIMSFAAIPFGLSYLGGILYPALEKPGLSLLITFFNNFLCPLLFSVPFAFGFGILGVSFGMMGGSFLTVALFSGIVIARYGKKGFPLYLRDTGKEVIALDAEAGDRSLAKQAALELEKRGFDGETISRRVGELYSFIVKQNPGKRVLTECTLLIGRDAVRVIVRDNGKICRFSEEDGQYLLTTSFNRNGFLFYKG